MPLLYAPLPPLPYARRRVKCRGMVSYSFRDDQYPFHGVDHLRLVARGIILDETGKVAIHHIYRNDIFCDQSYLETPGGGVDEGEDFETALKRECEEEIGYEIEILCPLCDVHDFYNLIGRENHNRFFLARRTKSVGKHFASSGDLFIQSTEYLPIDEVIALYEKQEDRLVAGLVKQRELPALRLAKDEMERRGII